MADEPSKYAKFQKWLFPLLIVLLLIGAVIGGLSFWRGQSIESEGGADTKQSASDPANGPAAEDL